MLKFVKNLRILKALLGLYVTVFCKEVMILDCKSVENSFTALRAIAKVKKLDCGHYFLDHVTHLIEL